MNRSADPNSDKMRAEFRQKLEKYEAAPSENLWDKIELSLDKEEALVYKNRFRVYSRLAAACLLLLLGFAAFFIPHKIKDLQTEATGIATSETPVNENKINVAADQQAETISANSKRIASENAMPSAGKTAGTTPETSAAKTTRQTTFETEPAKISSIKSRLQKGNYEASKTIAYNAENINAQAKKIKPTTSETPQNAMTFAAKTAPEVTTNPVPVAATTPETAAVEISVTNQPVPENTASMQTPEISVAQENTAGKADFNEDIAADMPEKAAIAASFKNANSPAGSLSNSGTNTFSPQSNSVSASEKSRFKLPLLSKKATNLSAPAASIALPDTNVLATLPVAENLTETEAKTKEKKPLEAGKWMLAFGYSGSRFSSGMLLASQAEPVDGNNINPQYQEDNIAKYEEAIEEFNNECRPAYSQKFSFKAAFKLSENWLVQSGLKFVRNQSKSRSHYLFSRRANMGNYFDTTNTIEPVFEVALNNSFNPIHTQIHETEATETTFRFQQIGIPLHIRYQTSGKALYYFADAGATLYHLKTAVAEKENQETAYPIHDESKHYLTTSAAPPMVFRKWLPAVELQTGIGYRLTKHWQLEMALEGEQYLKPLFLNEHETGAEQQKPVSIGGSLNLAYSF